MFYISKLMIKKIYIKLLKSLCGKTKFVINVGGATGN